MTSRNTAAVDEFDDFIDEAGAGQQEFDLQDYLRTVRKHKWPIVLFTALITVLGAYYAMTATPMYRATSTLLIESQQKGAVSFEGWVGLDNEGADYYETQFALLKSRELALRVVRHLDLANHPEFGNKQQQLSSAQGSSAGGTSDSSAQSIFTSLQSTLSDTVSAVRGGSVSTADAGSTTETIAEPVVGELVANVEIVTQAVPVGELEAGGLNSQPSQLTDSSLASGDEKIDEEQLVVSQFIKRLNVVPVKRTKLVKISFESADPKFAANVANTVGEQYIFAYLDSIMEASNKLSSWTNDQLGRLKTDLDQAESRVIEFKQANGLVDVNGSVSRLNEQEMSLYTNELASVRSELSDAEDLRREIQSYGGDIRLLEAVPLVQADPIVRDIKIEMGQRQRELDELSNRYGARHPNIVDAQSRLASLQANLESNVSRVISSLEKDYSLLRQRVSSVQSKLDQGKSDIQSLSVKNFELEDLEREVLSKQTVYQQFFNRVTEANSTDGLETANARIADFAVAPRNAFKPKKQLIIALAALAALVLSMLMAFLYEQMDGTVKSIYDVEKKLGVSMLGLMPLLKSGLFKSKSKASLPLNPLDIEDKRGTFAESFNTIRTALVMRESKKDTANTVVVTSSIPGEGKSTTSMNIAYSFSLIEKVLLIDADMRRPTIAKALGLERDVPGLSSLLTHKGNPRDCIQRRAIGELDVICSGPLPDQPLELLSSPRFKKLLEQLGGHYDRIILDCAPAQAVSDPLVLSKLADSVVYCVKSGSTEIDLASRGLDRLRQVNATLAGVVMTQVDVDKLASYGGDYYYQGYYDYYGYNQKGEGGTERLRVSPEELNSMGDAGDDYTYDFGFESPRKSKPATTARQMASEFDSTLDFGDQLSSSSKAGRQDPRDKDILDIL